ncbi:MAG: 1-deoxy-D-xylulose-5-phosphate synthase [Burkholderiales bacterium]|nr:1-deoxy-D-xylulose-5-phosphate synthase [Burkholderiales bacterium]
MNKYNLLEKTNYPHELKQLSREELQTLAQELRAFILDNVSKTGGHLASNLGSVELTIALHYVYNTPNDSLIWDVGHQSYPHKILTGRREKMTTLRQFNGLAGFPKRTESEYDSFDVGHSSTSISAALGMAVANKVRNRDHKVVAIIGDGSMTAGLAFEGLNNAGWLDTDMLVILNDNEMSISENVGAFSNYLSKILASRFYNTMKDTAKNALSIVPSMQKFAKKVEEHMKGMIMPSTMFEEFGFNYIGPVDGHDLENLIDTLEELKQLKGPQFLHIVTKKGQGYKLAENDPISYHGVSKFNPSEGMQVPTSNAMTYTQVFGKFLNDIAQIDDEFIAITPAMREGSGMVEFAKKYPDKFFDVGIAEQHAITFAGGAASKGIKPIVAIYSTFLQRGYDQLIHDVTIQDVPVLFAIDRAGVVGADGPTHIGAFDISFLRCIPKMIIMTPSDENECYQMLYTGFRLNQPCAVRYPRGAGTGTTIDEAFEMMALGKGKIIKNGEKIAILAFGSMVKPSLDAANELNATVCDMRFVKPIDIDLIKQISDSHDYIVTVEENVIMGGAGSACLEAMQLLNLNKPVLQIGIPDEFVEHGDPKVLLKHIGLDSDGIIRQIKQKNWL